MDEPSEDSKLKKELYLELKLFSKNIQ